MKSLKEFLKNISKEDEQLILEKLKEIIHAEKKEEKSWYIRHLPKTNDGYYALDYDGRIDYETWQNLYMEKDMFKQGNVFLTQEEAEEERERREIQKELELFALDNNEEEIDWKNFKQFKYYLVYDHREEAVEIRDYRSIQYPNTVYFYSYKTALNALETIGAARIAKLLR